MCTLLLAWQVFADAPVTLAATRDEAYDRGADPPRTWRLGTAADPEAETADADEELRVLAPRDRRAGGTWLGANEDGVVAAIANRSIDADLVRDRSRGLLVRDALTHRSAEAATRYVERELDGREYEGFTLVLADAVAATRIEWSGGRNVRPLDPGVHGVSNVDHEAAGGDDGTSGPDHSDPLAADSLPGPIDRGISGAPAPRSAGDETDRLRALVTHLQPEPGERSGAWLDRAARALCDHEYDACVHGDDAGTRSVSLVRVGKTGVTYRYADGPACEATFRTFAPDW